MDGSSKYVFQISLEIIIVAYHHRSVEVVACLKLAWLHYFSPHIFSMLEKMCGE